MTISSKCCFICSTLLLTIGSVTTSTDTVLPFSKGYSSPSNSNGLSAQLLSNLSQLVYRYFPGLNRGSADGVRQRRTNAKVAGKRGICGDIVALIPNQNVGITTKAQPAFWFYVGNPVTRTDSSLEFALQDSISGETIFRTRKDTKKLEAGLIAINLTGYDLTVNKRYIWKLTYNCGGQDTPILSGTILREEHPDIEPELAAALTPRHRFRIYAARGIWYELIDEINTLRQNDPSDRALEADFRSLIRSEDVRYLNIDSAQRENDLDLDLMERIVKAPVIDCCQ